MFDFTFAPQRGRVLAYTYDQLIYDGYELVDGEVALQAGNTLDLSDTSGIYELHLFDTTTEFRAIRNQCEWTIIFQRAEDENEDNDHFVFSESQFVQERYWIDGLDEKIVINNHFSFNEDGFLRLTGYRLAMETA